MRVWQADLHRPEEWFDAARASILGAGEGERRRGEPDAAWRRRVVARVALRVVLGRCLDRAPDSLAFERGPAGRPGLAARQELRGFDFNLARSCDLCLIAVSDSGPVGVDVERIRDFPELEGVARSRFAPSESAAILERSGPHRLQAFYRCWTRKEAYLKGIGTGIGAGLDGVVVSVEERPAILSGTEVGADWCVCDLELDEGFAGAVAVRGPRPQLSEALRLPVEEIDLIGIG
jgi:4'-phosphopantetheinyl transferase